MRTRTRGLLKAGVHEFPRVTQWQGECENQRLLVKLLKSHKEPGSVKPRVVHQMPSFSLESLSRWLMRVLREILDVHPALVKSSAEVVTAIKDIEVDRLFFAKADIKDFYVVGRHHRIAEIVSTLFCFMVRTTELGRVLQKR